MTFDESLNDVKVAFLDSAPVIYHIEGAAIYQPFTDALFAKIDAGQIVAVTSAITVAECLVMPLRRQLAALVSQFRLLLSHPRMQLATVDAVAYEAAVLRAQHNLSLPDAIQIAAAQRAGCDAFVTNDMDIRRVTGLRVIVLEDFVEN